MSGMSDKERIEYIRNLIRHDDVCQLIDKIDDPFSIKPKIKKKRQKK